MASSILTSIVIHDPVLTGFTSPRHQSGRKKKSCLLKSALVIACLKKPMSKPEISKKISNSESELGKKNQPSKKEQSSLWPHKQSCRCKDGKCQSAGVADRQV